MNKKKGKTGKIIRTVISGVMALVIVIVMIAANTVLKENDRIINSILNTYEKNIDNKSADTDGLDLEYNKADYSKDEIPAAEKDLSKRISQEGIVLMENTNNYLPYEKDTVFSFLSVNSVKLSVGGGLLGGGSSLKAVMEDDGVNINETLWKFYEGQKDFGLASGSISFGDAEDFSINEVPFSDLEKSEGLLSSIEGTVPVYVLKRVAGEGRDMPRSMYNHADNLEDKQKSYLEPDSKELEILSYLNDNFENTILVVNSNAAIELGWLDSYPNIQSVIYAPDGLSALPGILTGSINPSGRTVDTFALNALESPAAKNFGDYLYYDESGIATKYNYVTYAEGIYVGYRYYETRYEDVVLNQGNAGDFDYSMEVRYPFGYGLSYTEFEWKNQKVSWNGESATVSIEVTNVGDMAGKDVVEVYVQSPYTEYNKANNIEKASVALIGYGKTKELQPEETEKLEITFSQEQLKAYDANQAKTYVLDAGTYYITAAKNAHEAVNNILAMKGKTIADGMTDSGDKTFVTEYIPSITETDTAIYAKDSYSGAAITNQFDDAKGDVTYLSRNDWVGTFPENDGTISEIISTWGNEINGVDAQGNPASYTYKKEISSEDLAKLDAFDSGNPVDPETIETEIVYGADNGLTLIEMRGLDFDDPKWAELLDQLTPEDYYTMIALSGYGTEFLESVNKPFCIDADTAAGLIYGGTGKMFPNMMTLAQTWNQDLALEYGTMIGNEAIIGGADGWYAPAMNLHRTPFSGRNGEYYSEDPFLSGRVAANEVLGAASKGMYTYIKHLAFNDQENHRGDREGQFSIATWLNEQSARELYLLPFEICMKAGDVELNYVEADESGNYRNATRTIRANQAVMTGFNRIGYTWTGASYPLITGVLRNEWGFEGFILTDNANTGVFMDGYQMIEAGADGKLTYAEKSARFDFDKNDKATYYYGRQAMHRMLYTVANSKAMNGAMPGSVFENKMSFSDKLIIGVNIVGVLLLVLMTLLTIRRFRKPKENIIN